MFTAIHWYQSLSWTAFVVGILAFGGVARVLFGLSSAIATAILLFGFTIGLDQASTGMTEIYALLLMAARRWR